MRIDADAVPSFQGSVDGAIEHVAQRLREGWKVAVVAEGAGLVERAADVLAERELPARLVEEFPADPEPGVAYLVKAAVEHGFELAEAKLALLSESEFYGRTAGIRLAPGQEARDPPQERGRPAAAERRRLRRAPDARHRPVRRTRAARGLQRRSQRW